ncbi:lariat debranching enzyme [Ophidiomyces ophidiicola]|nr:lariat debranching enzyme [Ophidiomyces ophidiicola]KAI1994415.1 lariat debranching enzyme [Ophidiomyces ophidiicola]KAI1994979.1 lariat debranching enzyme [Ophidiomyces ophidiicola]
MASLSSIQHGFRLAVEGCGHGKLHDIYASVRTAAQSKAWDGVDLLIIGGDFQAVRNSNDMACMAVPPRYKQIGDFHEYYSGARVAPYLTIFVGGNHEASNHLSELYYGGWVAPKIYYLGAANVIHCGPLRIAGMSGIWKGPHYRLPHFERLPYDNDALRSIYHVREIDIRKLLQLRTQVDVGVSHDWPQAIEWSGDYNGLFRRKWHFREDAETGKLGSPAAKYVLDRLRPAHWFSAHLHVRYTAKFEHTVYIPPRVVNTRKYNTPPQTQQMRDAALIPDSEPPKQEEVSEPITEVIMETPDTEACSHSTTGGQVLHNEQERINAWRGFHEVASKREAQENAEYLKSADEFRRLVEAGEIEKPRSQVNYQVTWKKVVTDDNLSRDVTDVVRSTINCETGKDQNRPSCDVKNEDEIDIEMDSASEKGETTHKSPKQNHTMQIENPLPTAVEDVSAELRSQLPASFQKPAIPKEHFAEKALVEEALPESIGNKITEFLSLDKCEGEKECIELLEVFPISASPTAGIERPYQLAYDKEWLAITRVFADNIQIGGHEAGTADNPGALFYKEKIIEEEKWVEDNIVKHGKMIVPENFTVTAPVYDPSVPVTTHEQPFEYSNPQTSAFCEMLGIHNPLRLSDEKRREQEDAIVQANERRQWDPEPYYGRGRGHWGRRGGRGNRGTPYGNGYGHPRGGRGNRRGGRGRGHG